MVVVEGKKTVFLVVQVTLVVVLNLDIVGVVESTGDENERLGLGVGVGHDSEDAKVFQMREMNFVHHFLLHYPLHNLNLEQSYGDEGLVGDKEDDYDDDDLFWEDPDSDPCSAYLLPAFNRTTLLNQRFCSFFSHSSNCNCHHSETQYLLPLNFPISIITTKPKNALTVLSLTHSSICLSLCTTFCLFCKLNEELVCCDTSVIVALINE